MRQRAKYAPSLHALASARAKAFNFKDLSVEDKLEVGLGMKESQRRGDEAVGKEVNGWRISSLPSDSADYDGD